jgi:hypothetical protein
MYLHFKKLYIFRHKINPIVLVSSMLVVYLTTLSSTKLKQYVMTHDSNKLESMWKKVGGA